MGYKENLLSLMSFPKSLKEGLFTNKQNISRIIIYWAKRLIPKATCNIKKIQYKGRQSAEY